MKSIIRSIGAVGDNNTIYQVLLSNGVNIITGKSSTGKSALIEIVDYCLASSEDTIPVGVITRYADAFYVIIEIHNKFLFIVRQRNSNYAGSQEFDIKEDFFDPTNIVKSIDTIDLVPLSDHKKELKRFFSITVTDVDEDITERIHRRYNAKKPSPSVRSLTSFIFQHQNLIANKHAIFYRFDEKEKREQVIDHFKIFLGFANQEYFTLTQKLNEMRAELKAIENKIPNEKKRIDQVNSNFKDLADEFSAITGQALDMQNISNPARFPQKTINQIQEFNIEINPTSDTHIKQKIETEQRIAIASSRLRKAQQKLSDINSSIRTLKSYTSQSSDISLPKTSYINKSQCPFCLNHNHQVEESAKKLYDSIEWLNGQLSRSGYILESFLEDKAKVSKEINDIKHVIHLDQIKLSSILYQTKQLASHKTQFEIALKIKLKMEVLLEDMLNNDEVNLANEHSRVAKRIRSLENYLKTTFKVVEKMKSSNEFVEKQMKIIGENLEFEDTYKPIDLKFSFDDFELWNELPDGKKVYLRSMGSGANWLSAHITLFLALHKLFCSLGNKCSIPSILFFDQPSQVYFPSVDNDSEFSHLKDKDATEVQKNEADEDLHAVTKLYSYLVKYCNDTFKETSIMPQIIITDHADKLNFDGKIIFEDFVKARWRKRGFIHPIQQ